MATTVVTAEKNADLIKPVTDEEIYTAVFQMDPHKAPGSYGFGASFYQDHWVALKDLLCVAVKDFFRSGKLLKAVNHTLITLIPKVLIWKQLLIFDLLAFAPRYTKYWQKY